MKSLFWLLAVFAAAVALVVLGRVEAGYVLFTWPPYRVEMSMLFFAIALLLFFGVLYTTIRLSGHAIALPATVRAYRARRRSERANAALAAALQAFYEGRYARAEKEASVAFENGPVPGVAALLAARAAHQLREFERRELWFERAAEAGESVQIAQVMSQAEIALDERDFVGARNALRGLQGNARHIASMRLLLRAERGAGSWDEVLRLSAQLAKRDAIAPALAEEYKLQATIELLARSADDAGAFERRWRTIPAADQRQPRVAAAAARHANAVGNVALARSIVEQSLAEEWTPQLVRLYGELPRGLDAAGRADEARVRIESAERWLTERNRDADLLSALGRLCSEAELWGKARNFLEAALSFEESRNTHLELARLAERLGQPDEAQRHYRRAAELA
jgi:HemY protein